MRLGDRSDHSSDDSSDIRLSDLVDIVRRRWRLVAIVTALALIAAVAFAYTQPRIYRAEVVVVPVLDNDGTGVFGALPGQFAGIAQQVLGGSFGSNTQRAELVALLESRQVAREFIVSRKLLPLLFPERWNAKAQQWKMEDGKSTEPSMFAAVQRFDQRVRRIEENKISGIVKLGIELPERERVAPLANELVAFANEAARTRAIAESGRSVEYLNREIERTAYVDVKQALYRLLEGQLARAMSANVRSDFAFRVIDPAVTPDLGRHVKPRRLLIMAAGALAGFALGVIAALLWAVVRGGPHASRTPA